MKPLNDISKNFEVFHIVDMFFLPNVHDFVFSWTFLKSYTQIDTNLSKTEQTLNFAHNENLFVFEQNNFLRN